MTLGGSIHEYSLIFYIYLDDILYFFFFFVIRSVSIVVYVPVVL